MDEKDLSIAFRFIARTLGTVPDTPVGYLNEVAEHFANELKRVDPYFNKMRFLSDYLDALGGAP